MKAELQILINCCKTTPSEKDIAFLRSQINRVKVTNYSDPADLQTMQHLVHAQGIFPLFYQCLKTYASDLIPDDSMQELKQQYLVIVQRNMLMTAELISIMSLLHKNSINALAFKGPTLAQLAYGDITLRQYSDLDILVDENNIFKAGNLLTLNGYIPDKDLDFLQNSTLLDVSSDLGFRNSHNGTYIELHWKLFRKKLSINVDGLNILSNPTVIMLQGKKVKTLQSDVLLVYLCAHGSKHMWERIEWIADVDRFVRHLKPVDWESAWNYAKKMHSINTLLLGLAICKELFETDLPNSIEIQIRNNEKIRSLKKYTMELLNRDVPNHNSKLSAMFNKFDYQAQLYDSFWDKSKYYFSAFFKITPDDVLNINLPNYLFFVYFIIRPFRLAWKYLKGALNN